MYLYSRVGLGQIPTTLQPPNFKPGGGYAFGPAPSAVEGFGWDLGECVPAPVVLTDPKRIANAVASNARLARLLGWGPLRDQIEVNILGCPRANPQLPSPDFAQAVALFQRTRGLSPIDGILGSGTWLQTKAIQVEREPFPRRPLITDFDASVPVPNQQCEAANHPAIDIDLPPGTPIPVVADGIVIYAGPVGAIRSCPVAQNCQGGVGPPAICTLLSYGRVVIVEHPERGPGMHPGGLSVYTIYAHVQFSGAHRVASGRPVRAGRIIGEVGTGCVGFSGGPHLHYAVVTGRRSFRLTASGPARCQICARAYCDTAACPRCNFDHFWDLMTPQRPRTTTGPGFRW
jgi:Peptidase family M23